MWPLNASTFTGRLSTCSLVRPHRSQHPVPQVISGANENVSSVLWNQWVSADAGHRGEASQKQRLPGELQSHGWSSSGGSQQLFKVLFKLCLLTLRVFFYKPELRAARCQSRLRFPNCNSPVGQREGTSRLSVCMSIWQPRSDWGPSALLDHLFSSSH